MEELYKILLTERENDSKRYWAIFNLMNIINAGLLAVIATEKSQNLYYRDLAACFGMILCVVWLLAELRMVGWIRSWERKIRYIETWYLKEIIPTSESKSLYDLRFRIFKDRKSDFLWGIIPTRSVGPIVSVLFGVVWLLIRFPGLLKLISTILSHFIHH